MTREDSPSDDAPDEPDDVGGFRFGMADGSGEASESESQRRSDSGFDFQGWLTENVPGLGGPSAGGSRAEETGAAAETTETEPEASVEPADFAGFAFGNWLQETEERTSTTEPEPTPAETPEATATEEAAGTAAPAAPAATPETADVEEPEGPTETVLAEETSEAAAGRSYAGFDFRQWMTDEEAGPRKPPDTPRVVGASPSASGSPLAGLVAALPFGGSEETTTYHGGFDFAEWLGGGESEYFEPVDVETAATPTPEPSPAPDTGASASATAGASGGGFGEPPEFPTPPGGGISDTPPVKLAAFALFTAAIVAVALTAAGAIAPFGPADGFASSVGGDGAQEQPVATNTSTPTPTETSEETSEPTSESTPTEGPTSTPTPTEGSTPTEESTPTPTEGSTPTEESTPTPTPTEESTPTPTETPEDEDDDGGILDPLPT